MHMAMNMSHATLTRYKQEAGVAAHALLNYGMACLEHDQSHAILQWPHGLLSLPLACSLLMWRLASLGRTTFHDSQEQGSAAMPCAATPLEPYKVVDVSAP